MMRFKKTISMSCVFFFIFGFVALAADKDYYMVWDDFDKGFMVENKPGSSDAKWFYFGAGPFVGNNGIVKTSENGLQVISSGINPETGEPAFTLTTSQEGEKGNLAKLPGGFDHVKWLVYINHLSSKGIPGFDAQPGMELAFECWISGRTFGTENHPFGYAVRNHNDDLRLASFAMNTMDMETFMVFDFFITNETIYAFYERLPYGRKEGNRYAAFTFMKPVAKRKIGDWHHLKIAYDKSAGIIRWFIDDVEKFSVDKIGRHIDRKYMIIDHGGVQQDISMDQIVGGMGCFTLLEAVQPTDNRGLVRLSNVPGTFYNPSSGEPADLQFVDFESKLTSRLFYQGAELKVKKWAVSSKPVK